MEPVPTSGAHTAFTLKRGRSLGASNEVWFHRFSSPPFGSPFIPPPSHTSVSSLLSCPPVFMSVHLILFFVCVHIGPGLSVYVHFYIPLNTGFRSPRSLQITMRWASSGVPVHLVPLSFQPHAPLSRLVLLSCLHSFVLRVHTCTLVLTLALRLPSGRRVCVYPLESQGSLRIVLALLAFLSFSAGGPSMCCERWSNEAATAHADIWPDQPDVPAALPETLHLGPCFQLEQALQPLQRFFIRRLCTFRRPCRSIVS